MTMNIEKSQLADDVRSMLDFQKQSRRRRPWWLVLAAVITIAVLYSFVVTASSLKASFGRSSDALLNTVLNETLGFEKILVINVKSRTDRRDRITLAAAVTGLKLDFVDAVTSDEANPDIVPPVPEGFNKSKVELKHYASWRSHVNAIKTIVDQNLGSALILEDDADWDIRLKTQLRDWARSTRQLVQPTRADPNRFNDPSNFGMGHNSNIAKDIGIAQWQVDSPKEPYVAPTSSAYGDLQNWDVLWAGHCGQEFARAAPNCPKTPTGRVLMTDDDTAAETQHFANYWSGDEYKRVYSNHTRVTSMSCVQVCNTAYAVSNRGAQRLLYDYGVRQFTGMADAMLRQICDGENVFERRTCVSVTPPLFSQFSQKRNCSPNIRISTKSNLGRLVNGDVGLSDLEDFWPNGEPKREC